MLSQILVVSGTASGQTGKISRFIVYTLTNRGELPILMMGTTCLAICRSSISMG